MLRDKNLVPLSRQHQHALALCVRIDRASPIPESQLAAWQKEIAQHFHSEIRIHFSAEEAFVFPPARAFPELTLLVEELLAEHSWLRDQFTTAERESLSASGLSEFARRLSDHIRKEERRLFEPLQQLMNREQLSVLGHRLEEALQAAEQACLLPAEPARKLKM